MTSATLMLGGDFTSVATSVGLKPSERVPLGSVEDALAGRGGRSGDRHETTDEMEDDAEPWVGLYVPFDYGRQAIL